MTLDPGEADQVISTSSPEAPPAPGVGPWREYRATVAFLVASLFVLAILLLYSGILFVPSPVIGLAFVAGAVLGVLAMAAAAVGLATGRHWAVAVMTPMLVILAIGSAFQLVLALAQGTIDFPLGAILATWALRAPIRAPVAAARGARAWGIAGAITFAAMLASTIWPWAVLLLLVRPGG